MNKIKENFYIKDLTYMGISLALIIICTWIYIPTTIPFTLQTFAIFTTIGILGTKKAFITILAYLFLGIIGLPIFSNFNSGISAIVGPTGGFLLSFMVITLITGKLLEILPDNKVNQFISMLVGLLICYLIGIIWFINMYLGVFNYESIIKGLSIAIIPFIIPDILKILLSISIINKFKRLR